MDANKLATLFNRLHETVQETKILYDVSEAEMLILTQLVINSHGMGLSTKLTARLLKAAAHIIETSNELTDDFFKEEK